MLQIRQCCLTPPDSSVLALGHRNRRFAGQFWVVFLPKIEDNGDGLPSRGVALHVGTFADAYFLHVNKIFQNFLFACRSKCPIAEADDEPSRTGREDCARSPPVQGVFKARPFVCLCSSFFFSSPASNCVSFLEGKDVPSALVAFRWSLFQPFFPLMTVKVLNADEICCHKRIESTP